MILKAFLIYFVAPLFYTPNLDIYVNRWIGVYLINLNINHICK